MVETSFKIKILNKSMFVSYYLFCRLTLDLKGKSLDLEQTESDTAIFNIFLQARLDKIEALEKNQIIFTKNRIFRGFKRLFQQKPPELESGGSEDHHETNFLDSPYKNRKIASNFSS